jgi:hypothetical protein
MKPTLRGYRSGVLSDRVLEVGVVEVLKAGQGWTWQRRSQAGVVVTSATRSFRTRWSATRNARRANGLAVPCLRLRLELRRR